MIEKIDYTLLNPSATQQDILDLCDKAKNFKVKSVCVLPKMVTTATSALTGSDVLVCTVISFPHGTDPFLAKMINTKSAIDNGADEIDVVLNYPLVKEYLQNTIAFSDENEFKLIKEILDLSCLCRRYKNKDNNNVTLKIIVESGLLTIDETKYVTKLCIKYGADFIKTSTGMVSVGAELDKVQIMRNIIEEEGSNLKIKASGGLRTMEDLEKFEPYVDRFGVGFAAVDKIFGEIKSNNVETSY